MPLRAGGPPCQGMSGANKQAKRRDVLNDEENRLVEAFCQAFIDLEAPLVLLEQASANRCSAQSLPYALALPPLRVVMPVARLGN